MNMTQNNIISIFFGQKILPNKYINQKNTIKNKNKLSNERKSNNNKNKLSNNDNINQIIPIQNKENFEIKNIEVENQIIPNSVQNEINIILNNNSNLTKELFQGNKKQNINNNNQKGNIIGYNTIIQNYPKKIYFQNTKK